MISDISAQASEVQPVVLVTGASGFVGRHVIPTLKQHGWAVRPVFRRPSDLENSVIIDSIDATTDWQEALRGVDAVVHLAARVHHPHEEHAVEIYQSLNVEGTLNLARCSAKAGVRHFIYLSTALVNGDGTDGRTPFCEDDDLIPRGVYGNSKAAAEAGLRIMAPTTQMNFTVIRPPLLYGAGAVGNFRLLLKAVKLGFPLPFASIKNRRAFLSVDNLASFISYRLTHPGSKFDIFLIADTDQVSTPALVRAIAKSTDRPARLIPVPLTILRILFRLVGRPEAINSVIGSMEINTQKILATGWHPPLSLSEGLARTIASNSTE
jgi:UDP-glucose 4-epimerase